MIRPTGIAETVLYVDDLDRAVAFHSRVLNAPVISHDKRLGALKVGPDQVLLLFKRGATLEPLALECGVIPPHDGHGPLHVCFGINHADLETWEKHLRALGIPIESRVDWPAGAVSLYFRDPDNHAIELSTPGLWSTSGDPTACPDKPATA